MKILDTTPLFTNRARLAKKVKPIKAVHVKLAIVCPGIRPSLLMKTLEATEKLGEDCVLCVGEAGDTWPQDIKALLKKYDFTGYEAETGMQIFTPKPENEVEVIELTSLDAPTVGDLIEGTDPVFTILGKWGTEQKDGTHTQQGNVGDFVVRQTYDHTDQWIVRRNLFLRSYTFVA